MQIEQFVAGVVADDGQIDGLQNAGELGLHHVLEGTETGNAAHTGWLTSGLGKIDRLDEVVELQGSLELQEGDVVGTSGAEYS